jgi:hypothetical protein
MKLGLFYLDTILKTESSISLRDRAFLKYKPGIELSLQEATLQLFSPL